MSTPVRIMLVDDHKTMLWGLEKLIEGGGSDLQLVGTASNNDTALQQASALKPDVIVLDLDLEGRSSIEILPQLLQENPGVKVMILSGNRDQGLLTQAVKLGARGVVSKEAPADVVLNSLRAVQRGETVLDPALMNALLGQLSAPVKINPEAARIASLTPKERKIVAVIVEGNGAPNKELASRLFIAEPTLRNNLTTIYQKLGVANRLELYVYATKHGLQAV
ncbi:MULTISPECIES: response regulator transcription factor [unclassified Duganella]|uniref:response regulator transcription factor n=1 Tax=unclassified Duganella TaxID=2636909 RepID=UPI0008823E1F|nr:MULTISPECIES: response regulator transcription factor [unclassified Duganella]SDF94231.1 two component transcriptional regulator, LuxR family [Duganella sp. OV458]SDJ10514.1 two component transcriptional regulator, LuxR family [Duganella sp. OV510]